MMYLPSLFDDRMNEMEDMMNDMDRDFWNVSYPVFGHRADRMMRTDVREHDNGYELDVELPGFKKEELKLSLKDGYLTIHAEKTLDKDEKEKKSGKLLRQERYGGTLERTFYIGDVYSESDIKAQYENGVLKITLPRKDQKKVDTNKYIAITG